MSNRPSGVLTPTDRDFLKSEDSYYQGDNARQSRYQRRRDIRQRIVASLLDFTEINTYLDQDERRKIFSEPEKNGADDYAEFGLALQSLLGWVYIGLREEGEDFSTVLDRAITRAEKDYQAADPGRFVDVEVDLDVKIKNRHNDIEEIGRALEEGERIFAGDIYRLPEHHEIPVDIEEIDTVRIIPEKGQYEPEKEKKIVKSILQIELGIDADVEIEGLETLPEESEDQK